MRQWSAGLVGGREAGFGEQPSLALDDLEHEPDEPIYTDRITAIMRRRRGIRRSRGRQAEQGLRSRSNIVTMTVRDLEPGRRSF